MQNDSYLGLVVQCTAIFRCTTKCRTLFTIKTKIHHKTKTCNWPCNFYVQHSQYQTAVAWHGLVVDLVRLVDAVRMSDHLAADTAGEITKCAAGCGCAGAASGACGLNAEVLDALARVHNSRRSAKGCHIVATAVTHGGSYGSGHVRDGLFRLGGRTGRALRPLAGGAASAGGAAAPVAPVAPREPVERFWPLSQSRQCSREHRWRHGSRWNPSGP